MYYLYSASKVITCAAALQLHERGEFLMFQPVSDFIPEFRNMKVAHRMLNGDVEIVPAMRPIRIQDLFTMTGGLSYDLDSPAIRRIRRETDGRCPTLATVNKIYEEYKTLRQSGEGIGMNHFINHPDPEVSNVVVNLLTYDDNYMVSKLWKKFDIVVESEQERLPVAVPRAVILYKSKVIDDIIAGLRAKLADQSLPEEEQATLTHQISVLNQERTLISKKLSRLIV